MQKPFTPNLLHWFIAFVWLANGLLCKAFNLVPRHQQIVAKILGDEPSRLLTILIGIAEVAMAVWILTGTLKRLNVLVQILVIATMNTIEFFLVPDLLLWGKANAFFAAAFIGFIYYNEFRSAKKLNQQVTCRPF
jgi:hypothetical protein